jgi:Tfp pilus assembly protein PilF
MNIMVCTRLILSSIRLCILVYLAVVTLELFGDLSYAAGQEADLKLRIQASAGNRDSSSWVLEFHKASGQYVRMLRTITGNDIHIKHLVPGIYTACLRGIHGRERCQSIDMFIPKDGKNHVFAVDLKAPDSLPYNADQNSVQLQQLRVPAAARHEFQDSLQAEMRQDEQGMLKHLKRALEIEPSYADALNNLGAYYYRVGNETLAIQYLTKVTQLNPDLYSGWINLAGVLLITNRWEDALKAALKGVALRPEDALSNSQVARCYYYLNRPLEAEPYFQKVLALDPLFPDPPMLYLARIAAMDHRQKEAEDYIHLFLKLHPNYPHATSLVHTLRMLILSRTAEPPATVAQQRQQWGALP